MTSPLIQTMRNVPFEQHPTVRIGFIGCGGRGRGLLRDLLNVEGVEIVALYDPNPDNAARASSRVTEAGQPAPTVFTEPDGDRHLVQHPDVDFVYIASPWEAHTPQAVAAMEAGKHVAVEVPAATTLEECWQLVKTSERTRRHCVMLENCCYDYHEMMLLQMVQAGVLGTLTYAEAAYIHDLRALLFNESSEGAWRREGHKNSDGNLYPTHGLGPVARCLGIHRGDRFTRLVSMSSREAGLTEWRDKSLAPDDPRRAETYRCGDINTSLLQTALGRTVLLQHDVITPRPYTRLNSLAGTKGMFIDYPPRLYLEDRMTRGHVSGNDKDAYLDSAVFREFEHPLWTQFGGRAREMGGHGGCDYLMSWRLIQCLREGLPPDMDVYDAAAWSAPTPLSEMSVAAGNAPVEFPDFTRGHWAS